MPNDFQVNFLNGLEMARSTQGAKLDAMQQAASMQYQISAKQMDFQMGLLKLRESQAAQAVEMRMAQDEHQLKLKDYALRAKESELRASQLSQEMETKNVAMHAGAAISDLENKLVLQGLDSSSPEFLLAQVEAVKQGRLFANTDPKIANVIGSTLTAKLRTTQEGFYNSGLEALEKVNASRQVSLGNEETGVTLTDRMLGAGDKAKLIAVADRFNRGAILGHEPSRRMYREVMGLIDGVTAPAPGVQPAAASATEQFRQQAGIGTAAFDQFATSVTGLSDEKYVENLQSSVATEDRDRVNTLTGDLSRRLLTVEKTLARNPQAALGLKRLRDRLDLAREATVSQIEGGRGTASRTNQMRRSVSSVAGLPIGEIERLAAIKDDAELAKEIDRLTPVSSFSYPALPRMGY